MKDKRDLRNNKPDITPAKPLNPMTTKKTVGLAPKTKLRLDTLQNELEQSLAPLRQQMANVQQSFVNRMTDTVAGFLDGLGIDVDLNLDTVNRTEDGLALEITFARPVKADQPAEQPEPTVADQPADAAAEPK